MFELTHILPSTAGFKSAFSYFSSPVSVVSAFTFYHVYGLPVFKLL